MRYTKSEKVLRRSLELQLESATSEVTREHLRQKLQAVRDAAIARTKERAKEKAAPETDPEWDTSEWHRLEIKEKACQKILNNPKAHLVTIRMAEKELERIAKRRRELRPEECESESASVPAFPESLPDLTKMSDSTLRERFNKERFFRNYLSRNSNGELIASLEQEIRSRHMLLVWSVKDTDCLYVNERSEPIDRRLVVDSVYMGEVSLPED
jgi:hypothetical protein